MRGSRKRVLVQALNKLTINEIYHLDMQLFTSNQELDNLTNNETYHLGMHLFIYGQSSMTIRIC